MSPVPGWTPWYGLFAHGNAEASLTVASRRHILGRDLAGIDKSMEKVITRWKVITPCDNIDYQCDWISP
jgi:hypothetical protein